MYLLYSSRIKYSGVVAKLKPEIATTQSWFSQEGIDNFVEHMGICYKWLHFLFMILRKPCHNLTGNPRLFKYKDQQDAQFCQCRLKF